MLINPVAGVGYPINQIVEHLNSNMFWCCHADMYVRMIIVDAPAIGRSKADRKALIGFTPPETALVQRIHEVAYGLIDNLLTNRSAPVIVTFDCERYRQCPSIQLVKPFRHRFYDFR